MDRTWHVERNQNEGPNFGKPIAPPGSLVSDDSITLGTGFLPEDEDYGGPYFPDGTSAVGYWFNGVDVPPEGGEVTLNPPGPKA